MPMLLDDGDVKGFFFHSFIGCSSSDIQYKFVIQHTKKKKTKQKEQKPKRGRCNGTNVP